MFQITNTPHSILLMEEVFKTDNIRQRKYGRYMDIPRQLSLHVDPESLGEPPYLAAFALISNIDRLYEIEDDLSGENVTAAIYIIHPYDTFEPELYYRNEMGLYQRHFKYEESYHVLMGVLERFSAAIGQYYARY